MRFETLEWTGWKTAEITPTALAVAWNSNSNHSNNKSNRNHNRNCRYEKRIALQSVYYCTQLFTLIKFLTEIDVYKQMHAYKYICVSTYRVRCVCWVTSSYPHLHASVVYGVFVIWICNFWCDAHKIAVFATLGPDAWHHAKWLRAWLSFSSTKGRRILTYFDYISVASLIWIHEAIFIRYFYFFRFGLAIFSLLHFLCRHEPSSTSCPMLTYFRLQHNALCVYKRGSCLRMQYLCSMWMEYSVGGIQVLK